jgi:hypothetical protein
MSHVASKAPEKMTLADKGEFLEYAKNPTDPEHIKLKEQAEQLAHEIEDDMDAYDVVHVQAMQHRVSRTWLGKLFNVAPFPAAEDAAGSVSIGEVAAKANATATVRRDLPGGVSELDMEQQPVVGQAQPVRNDRPSGRSPSAASVTRTTSSGVQRTTAAPASAPINLLSAKGGVHRLMYKKYNPNRPPLIARWYIPWTCLSLAVLIWTPDVWKLKALYLADGYYAQLRRSVHTAYWRATMDPDEFVELMTQLEANLPRHLRSVKGSNCPM